MTTLPNVTSLNIGEGSMNAVKVLNFTDIGSNTNTTTSIMISNNTFASLESIVVGSDEDKTVLDKVIIQLPPSVKEDIEVEVDPIQDFQYAVLSNMIEWNTTNANVVRVLTIPSNCFNELSSVNFSYFSRLRDLIIGDNSFKNVAEFKMENMQELETLIIGENSFYNPSIYLKQLFILRSKLFIL